MYKHSGQQDPTKLKRLLTTAIENAEGFGLQ